MSEDGDDHGPFVLTDEDLAEEERPIPKHMLEHGIAWGWCNNGASFYVSMTRQDGKAMTPEEICACISSFYSTFTADFVCPTPPERKH